MMDTFNVPKVSLIQRFHCIGLCGCPQESCGASYAFSTTGSIEGAIALGYGRLVSLSEQNIIDCSG